MQTSWTKRSRGGVEASRRHAVPTAFLLPGRQAPFVHFVSMDEHDGFEPRFAACDGLPVCGTTDSGVVLEELDGSLRVETVVTPYGRPRRWHRPRTPALTRGEWLRWRVNYRFSRSDDGEWTYRLDVFNIGYGSVSGDEFLGTPTYRLDELAALR